MRHTPERLRRPPRATIARAAASLAFLLVALLSAACGSDATGPGGGGSFGNVGGLLGGFRGTGFTAFGLTIDPQFNYLYFNDTQAEGPWNCDTDGYCSIAGLKNTFGAIVEADSFMVVSTANVNHNGADRVVRNSGVATKAITIPNGAQYSALRLSFQFVFASARTNTTHADSAIIRVKSGNDSATVFRVTAADMQSGGTFPARAGGCGSASIVAGRSIAYPTCTSWVTATADLSAFRARTFTVQFIAAEAGQSAADHVDQPVAFLFRNPAIEGAK